MPHEPVMPKKRKFARRMRRQPTEAEERLWRVQRGRRLDGIKVRRQVPFDPYVADFLCAEAMLVIEVDGGQHGGSARDERRTRFFNAKGYRVLRFWNDEVLREMDVVCATIMAYMPDAHLLPTAR